MAGLWGLAAPPFLVVFEPGFALAFVWSLLGMMTLVFAIWADEAVTVFWMRGVGFFFLLLAVVGFSIDGAVLGLFNNTTPNNLLHLAWALGFFWDGFVSDALARVPAPEPVTKTYEN